MTVRTRIATLLAAPLAATLLLAGCASSSPHAPARPASMTPGMVMPDGSTMGAMAANANTNTDAKPSAAAAMICSAEARGDIATALGVRSIRAGVAQWHAPHYRCSYALPMGTLVLSVHEAGSPAAGAAYLTSLRQHLHASKVAGLTEQAYSTPAGDVLLLKDGDVLHVDATGLPAVFGPQHQKRTDLAYEIASDILGCWTGDGS